MGPGNKPNILQLIAGAEPLGAMRRAYDSAGRTVLLRDMVGGALSVYAAALIARTGGTHVFVAEDRDAAAYLLNDFYALLDEKQVYFFPGSYKRSIVYGTEDAQGVVQRTAALSALRREMAAGEYRIICTYPEALAERVTDPDSMRRETVRVKVGDRLAIGELEELLADSGFTKVDFVYEPGQYSLRGGIFDVFSFSESKPYRLDFFGEEVDSIRRFEISSQLSADRLNEVEIVPNLNGFAGDRISLLAFAGEATYWFFDPDYVLRRVNDLRRKVLGEMEEPAEIDTHLVSRKVLLQDMAGMRLFELRDSLKERPADATVAFRMAPQPKFNKNFELLADDIISNGQRGYKTYILSENRAQLERLENIFYQSGRKEAQINPLPITLHEGFVDHDLKLCFYTDHQIFDRYQRYRINGEIKRDEQMTVAELNQLRMGDYVVHIDHGVGRFGGLVKINENGKVHEAIKLIYKDNDVLFVHVHALHRISRYKSGEGEAPKIYKLGSGAWQKLKTATKKAVKDISRELIALYAKRKASKGFAFSPDTYLQQELEASFMWEDTPDQQTATQAVKRDMESNQPMDRLICGDVGFGKTEVAIRAAFKAATDGKQVAVLVPTTILAWQHYTTILSRMEAFPVKAGLLSRFASARQQKETIKGLAAGTVDVVVGTHRMLQKDVKFHDLGLVIIDEEQRFGVKHKEKLKENFIGVDMLTLSATPIPRTLNMAMSGLRDMSTIEEPPFERRPIETYVMEYDAGVVAEALRRELDRGGQAYYIHNRIDTIDQCAAKLAELLPGARIATAHGRMDEATLSG
ncbi:DEAD/DEAH box helicase, partial [Alistipes putredinis]|uniref:DEAD/DEAH box helicase n=1 Tax=Alistipes putredinis TaxID=28117 RepID=UPI003AAEE11B